MSVVQGPPGVHVSGPYQNWPFPPNTFGWFRGWVELTANANATPRFMHAVDLTAAAGSVTITLPAVFPATDEPYYFGFTNDSTVADGSKVVIVQTSAAVEVVRLSAAGESVWLARNPANGNWRQIAYDNPSEYQWTWANSAAKMAAQVSAAQVGKVGFQTDIGLAFRLAAVTNPLSYGMIDDPTFQSTGELLCNAAGNQGQLGLNILQLQTGAFAARTLANTNDATARPRNALNTGAVAGNTAYVRGTGGQQTAAFGRGLRYRIVCGPGAVATGMRWVYGLYDILAANVNQAPTVVLNAIAVGADGGDLEIYTNDGAGAATATPVGTAGQFPGATAPNVYDVLFYSPAGLDVRYLVRNLATGIEVSGTIVGNLPATTHFFNHGLFSCNNLQAAAISSDLAFIDIQQRDR